MTMDDVIVSKKIKSFLPKGQKVKFCHYDNESCHNVKVNKVFPLERQETEFCHYDNGLYRYDEEK